MALVLLIVHVLQPLPPTATPQTNPFPVPRDEPDDLRCAEQLGVTVTVLPDLE